MEFKYRLEFGDSGLPYVEDDPGAKLRIEFDDGQVAICGDRAGLLLLAKKLIALAEFDKNTGFHFHLEPGRPLEEGSAEVIIHKVR